MTRTKSAPAPATININRTVRAPLRRVFAKWAEPALLAKWWGPVLTPGEFTTHELVLEARIGGNFRWVYTDSKGQHHTVHGEVFELVTNEKIAFTWTDDEDAAQVHHDASRVIVDFREGRGVEIRLHHSKTPDGTTHDQFEVAWNSAFDRLEQALAG